MFVGIKTVKYFSWYKKSKRSFPLVGNTTWKH
jgi:hypothetical protein